MAQAAQFFELSWVDAAKWGHPQIGDIELADGPPAMVKHLLEQERMRKNKEEYMRKIKDMKEKTRNAGASADLNFEQAIGGKSIGTTWQKLQSGQEPSMKSNGC